MKFGMLILYDVPYRGFEGFLKISIIFHFMDIFKFEDLKKIDFIDWKRIAFSMKKNLDP